jgi:hypothetical protein
MPHRVVSLESTTSYIDSYSTQQNIFPLVHETVFYTNKQSDPKSKTLLRGSLDVKNPSKHELNSNADLVFSMPGLGKDMQINSKTTYDKNTYCGTFDLVLDIFKKKEQKIVVSGNVTPKVTAQTAEGTAKLHIDGKGLGFNVLYDEKFFLGTNKVNWDSSTVFELDKQKKVSSWHLDLTETTAKIQVRHKKLNILNRVMFNFISD